MHRGIATGFGDRNSGVFFFQKNSKLRGVSAWAKWLNTGDGDSEESRVILDISFYGAVDKEDGWLITDFDGDENTPMGPIEMTVEEQMHWSAIKAEFLCPKM